jgi:uncharacterized protein
MRRFSYTGCMNKEFVARRLDLKSFAQVTDSLSGEEALAAHARLAQEAHGPLDGLAVKWTARGEFRPGAGGGNEVWLHLQAIARLPLTCQRCMNPVDTEVSTDRWFRFAADEATAAALDDESEEDVLVLSSEFDLLTLVEDELLMALPLVPRHETCPVNVKLAVEDADFAAAAAVKPSPFAALASLRLDKSS